MNLEWIGGIFSIMFSNVHLYVAYVLQCDCHWFIKSNLTRCRPKCNKILFWPENAYQLKQLQLFRMSDFFWRTLYASADDLQADAELSPLSPRRTRPHRAHLTSALPPCVIRLCVATCCRHRWFLRWNISCEVQETGAGQQNESWPSHVRRPDAIVLGGCLFSSTEKPPPTKC